MKMMCKQEEDSMTLWRMMCMLVEDSMILKLIRLCSRILLMNLLEIVL